MGVPCTKRGQVRGVLVVVTYMKIVLTSGSHPPPPCVTVHVQTGSLCKQSGVAVTEKSTQIAFKALVQTRCQHVPERRQARTGEACTVDPGLGGWGEAECAVPVA